MIDYALFRKLHQQGLICDDSAARLEQQERQPLFSVHWEVKTLLYIGIVLLTSGLGLLVYKNIDSIGHGVILALLGLLCAGCFAYCFKHKKPFSRAKTDTPDTFFDYVLLLGTLSLLIFLVYLQYQYNVFGHRYGLAAFIPMVLLFYIAYDFDHIAILNMAIVNFGLWLGITVTPQHLLDAGNFGSQSLILTYLSFGLCMLAVAWGTHHYVVKRHFAFTYQHYGVHIGFIALLAGYLYNYNEGGAILWMLGIALLSGAIIYDAYKFRKFYFFLLSVLYTYLAVSCLVVRLCINSAFDEGGIIMLFIYFIISGILLIRWLIHMHHQFKTS